MKEKAEMSIKEAKRLSVMRQVDKKILTLFEAGKELELSLRQTKRVRKRYLEQGEQGLISLKRGKESNRKICQEFRDKAIRLIKTKYSDFGPTLASEKLASLIGQVVKELGIGLICAHSPQAKGRIERKNGVFQDRLIKEMRLRGINTIEEANAFLPEFLEEINLRFGKEAADPKDAHRPLRVQDNLARIFARKDQRKLSKDLTFQHHGIMYLIQTKTPNRMRHAYVGVLWKEGEPIEVEYNGTKLEYKKWSETVYERPKVLDSKEKALPSMARQKGQHINKHPWR